MSTIWRQGMHAGFNAAIDCIKAFPPGAPHGMCSTLEDQVNAELPAFFKA